MIIEVVFTAIQILSLISLYLMPHVSSAYSVAGERASQLARRPGAAPPTGRQRELGFRRGVSYASGKECECTGFAGSVPRPPKAWHTRAGLREQYSALLRARLVGEGLSEFWLMCRLLLCFS